MPSPIMARRYRGPERRSTSRPHAGDLEPCPKCSGIMRFEERLALTRHGITAEKAAWVCRNPECSHERFVRAEDRGENPAA